MEEVSKVCTPWNDKEAQENKHIELNRLEDHLLKLAIPFIRIGHLPRGRYFQLKGNLIMVSANLADSMKKILPLEQNLLPVSLKRKLQYGGHYIKEYIDRPKVQTYLNWYRLHNHLFEDIEYDEKRIDTFEEECMAIAAEEDSMKNDLLVNHQEIQLKKEVEDEIFYSDDEEEKEINVSEPVDYYENHGDQSTFITNKYFEDTKSDTVANKFSNLIIALESVEKNDNTIVDPDPEHKEFIEDEYFNSSDEEEEIGFFSEIECSEEETEVLDYMKSIHCESKESLVQLKSNAKTLCKCGIARKISLLMDLKFNLEKKVVITPQISTLKKNMISDFSNAIKIGRNAMKSLEKNCNHTRTQLSEDIENIVENNQTNTEKVSKYVKKQIDKIRTITESITLAPSEEGSFLNWKSEIFLEEKLFPKLFPYGIGGYLSSNMLRESDMGFSNYIKNRLLSADPKFRNDPTYVFFLLLVKELTDMKRSEQTFLRKATKAADLSRKQVSEIDKENLFRYDNAYSTFKNIRGTSMYYEDVKKRVMATVRQNGAPSLFCTFSCAEFSWNELAQNIYQTVNKKPISIEEVRQKPAAWKNRLINQNVTQSTLHFSKRTDKLVSLLKSESIFKHENQDFKATSFFYRVEYQARGAPHIHMLIWLEDQDGNKPPAMWEGGKDAADSLREKIASFGSSAMCGSAKDMNCENHHEFDNNCNDCLEGKLLVEKFQTHTHTHTCRKKGKVLRISSNEGFGRHDKSTTGEELLVPVCRLRHPKFPCDTTEFIYGFSEDEEQEVIKNAKKDYNKIRKYLLRMTHGEKFRESVAWKHFVSLNFTQFLYEVGMLDGESLHDVNEVAKAKARYLKALKCEVKSSGLLLLKRNTEDILTNNFNKHLIKMHQANQDIQFITDEYAVVEYICNYITKNESGSSSLLRNINEEAIKQGEETIKTIKKIGKALDKGRVHSIRLYV